MDCKSESVSCHEKQDSLVIKVKQDSLVIKVKQGVNFINVLRTNFSYERRFGNVHVTRKSYRNQCLYEKFARLTLMKLTAAVSLGKRIYQTSVQINGSLAFINL
jgi:hypothetical protein